MEQQINKCNYCGQQPQVISDQSVRCINHECTIFNVGMDIESWNDVKNEDNSQKNEDNIQGACYNRLQNQHISIKECPFCNRIPVVSNEAVLNKRTISCKTINCPIFGIEINFRQWNRWNANEKRCANCRYKHIAFHNGEISCNLPHNLQIRKKSIDCCDFFWKDGDDDTKIIDKKHILFGGFYQCIAEDTIYINNEAISGEWIYGIGAIANKIITLDYKKEEIIMVDCIENTIRQYTGYCDMDGSKIFEYDTVYCCEKDMHGIVHNCNHIDWKCHGDNIESHDTELKNELSYWAENVSVSGTIWDKGDKNEFKK